MRKDYAMSSTATMSKPNDYYVLLAGLLGLLLGILLAKPTKVVDAVFATLAGIFSAVVIAPAVAEVFTSLSTFSYLTWLNAAPDTALYTAIIGIGGMLGFQIVVAVKDDFLNWLRKFANKRLKVED